MEKKEKIKFFFKRTCDNVLNENEIPQRPFIESVHYDIEKMKRKFAISQSEWKKEQMPQMRNTHTQRKQEYIRNVYIQFKALFGSSVIDSIMLNNIYTDCCYCCYHTHPSISSRCIRLSWIVCNLIWIVIGWLFVQVIYNKLACKSLYTFPIYFGMVFDMGKHAFRIHLCRLNDNLSFRHFGRCFFRLLLLLCCAFLFFFLFLFDLTEASFALKGLMKNQLHSHLMIYWISLVLHNTPFNVYKLTFDFVFSVSNVLFPSSSISLLLSRFFLF